MRHLAEERRRERHPRLDAELVGDALGSGHVVNETVNLAYGEGNTLVYCAERIAHELGTEPQMTLAPSLLGEVTHYVADLSKARGLLGYSPKVSLDEGIARAVAWFREHRATHPEEDVPVLADHEGSASDAQPVWKPAAASVQSSTGATG